MNFKEYLDNFDRMHISEDAVVSESLSFHLNNKLNLHDNIFRIGSKAYFDLINEVRNLYNDDKISLNDEDLELIESDIGQFAEYKGKKVPLDLPFILNEAEYKGKKVSVGKPFRTPGEKKKFAVYVKTPSGRIKKVRFGDPNLKIKNNNPARAKSFRARHKCSEKKDRTKAGYWACRIGRYAKSVGLKSSKSW